MVRKASPVSRSASTASSSSASAGDNGGNGSSTIPTALPTHEALRILLSPDGYYEYLGIPKPTDNNNKSLEIMGATTTTNAESSIIDLERVKKNYRRLSLKHHPDRRTGNAEAFRMLNRAKIVLSNSKLRREYDLLGLDLDDDAEDEDDDHEGGGGGNDDDEEAEETVAEIPEEEEKEEEEGQPREDDNVINSSTDHNGNTTNINNNAESSKRDINEGAHRRRPTKSPTTKTSVGGTRSGKQQQQQHEKDKNNKGNGNNQGGGGGGSKTETVMGHLASASLAAVLQVVVRTGLMGVVSVLISRYAILVSRVISLEILPFSILFVYLHCACFCRNDNVGRREWCGMEMHCSASFPNSIFSLSLFAFLLFLLVSCNYFGKFDDAYPPNYQLYIFSDLPSHRHAYLPLLQTVHFPQKNCIGEQCQSIVLVHCQGVILSTCHRIWYILHVSWTTIRDDDNTRNGNQCGDGGCFCTRGQRRQSFGGGGRCFGDHLSRMELDILVG